MKTSGGEYSSINTCANAIPNGDSCTVFAGTYAEHVTVPAGGVGAYKTLQVNGTDLVYVLDFTINSHTKVIGFHIQNPASPHSANCVSIVNNTTDYYITNNVMYACGSNGMIAGVNGSDTNSYGYIQGNTLSYSGTTNVSPEVFKGMAITGNYHLVENNDISHVDDGVSLTGSYNVFRNNTFHNTNETECSVHGCHIDFIESEPNSATQYNVYENNTIRNHVGPNSHAFLAQGDVCAGNCSNLIVRYNDMAHVGSGGIVDDNAGSSAVVGYHDVKSYNNTWVDFSNVNPDYGQNNAFTFRSTNASQVNDLFYYPNAMIDFNPYSTDAASVPFTVKNNLGWCANVTCNLRGSTYGSGSFTTDPGNIKVDPLFANYASNDFRLAAGSPALGAGTYLTQVAAGDSGTGTSLVVNDAAYFQAISGLNGVTADWIRVGASTTAQISSINYGTNTITLASSITRSVNDPVYLYKNTSGAIVLTTASPNMGALGPAGTACTTTPVISGFSWTQIDAYSGTAAWTTNCLSDTRVTWSNTGNDTPVYYTPLTDPAGTLSHSVTVTGLRPSMNMAFSYALSKSIADPNKVGLSQFTMTTAAPPAGPFDYYTDMQGPHKVFQGSKVYIAMINYPNVGTDTAGNLYHIQVSGLPPNSTVEPDNTLHTASCSFSYNAGTQTIQQYYTTCGWTNVGIVTTASTPPGDYTITFNMSNNANTPVARNITWPLTVEAPATFYPWGPSTYTAIPCLDPSSTKINGSACVRSWQSDMITYGQTWCLEGSAIPGTELGMWYYDGTKSLTNIKVWDTAHSVTGNPAQWDACVEFQANHYYAWVNGLSNIPNWRTFPHGGQMHYGNSGDSQSLSLVTQLHNKQAFGLVHADHAMIDRNYVRELAYNVGNDLAYYEMTGDSAALPYLNKNLYISLGRADQWVSGEMMPQFFMIGLWAESLIKCYESSVCPMYHDSRIPVVIQRVYDWIWTWYGVSQYANCWPYSSTQHTVGLDNTITYNTAVNLMTGFAYAWLFSITNNTGYRDKAHLSFQDGILYVPGDGPDATFGTGGAKKYNQQYRMSFDTVRWLSPPPYTPALRRAPGGKVSVGGKYQ